MAEFGGTRCRKAAMPLGGSVHPVSQLRGRGTLNHGDLAWTRSSRTKYAGGSSVLTLGSWGGGGGCVPPGGGWLLRWLVSGPPAGPIPAVTDSITPGGDSIRFQAVTDSITPGGDSIRLPAVTPSLLQLWLSWRPWAAASPPLATYSTWP